MNCLSCPKDIDGLGVFGVEHCWDCYVDPLKLYPELTACN